MPLSTLALARLDAACARRDLTEDQFRALFGRADVERSLGERFD